MQMMSRRADGENGSTVKIPNQDAVIGQIFLFSVVLDCLYLLRATANSK